MSETVAEVDQTSSSDVETNKPEPLAGTVPVPGVSYPLKVQYCGECTLPFEYCALGGRSEKCKTWFDKNMAQLVADGVQIADDVEEAQEGKKHQKRGGKGQPKVTKEVKSSQITLQRAPRGKNKSVTVVKGLSTFGIDLKPAAKFFAARFACGSSVTATDEIVVQGDVKDELFDIIPEKWPQVDEESIVDLGDQKR
ncbi:Density-regulated protein [Aphelenchoides besseyi]|nr:Density-regulated protein [Aphelenchoides besseyi]